LDLSLIFKTFLSICYPKDSAFFFLDAIKTVETVFMFSSYPALKSCAVFCSGTIPFIASSGWG